ncbi:procathepsin L [Drosophila obscura]|uniref:procathepsin L n=1 Tax=Drosophila obscura TaxID=7282 RepID=UPI001BB1FA77|nr:procathepsin L [Drosophila obscura]
MNLPRSGLDFQPPLLLLLLLWIACATARVSRDEWESFKAQYGKWYNEYDNIRHYGIYNRTVQMVQQHNSLFAAGSVSFEMGLNEYSDTMQNLLPFEAEDPPQPYRSDIPVSSIRKPPNYKYYDQIRCGRDWRNCGIISPVGNQGNECLSCWAFAAAGAIEAHLALKSNRLVQLSPKQLLDCSKLLNRGCGGGWVSVAYTYVKNNGIARRSSYPYRPQTEDCRYSKSQSAGSVLGYVTLTANERELAELVYNVGPVTVSIDHIHPEFQHYSRGVLNVKECRSDRANLRHAMLLVGFGSDPKLGDYWLLKNSMGRSWGIDGYLKLARNAGNMCGVASIPQYPLV